jgi:hypothetical protein
MVTRDPRDRVVEAARALLKFMDTQWPPDAVAFGRRDDLRDALDALDALDEVSDVRP